MRRLENGSSTLHYLLCLLIGLNGLMLNEVEGVECSYNSTWTDVFVYGANDYASEGLLTSPEDFMFSMDQSSLYVLDSGAQRVVTFEIQPTQTQGTTAYNLAWSSEANENQFYSIGRTNSSIVIGTIGYVKQSSSLTTLDFGTVKYATGVFNSGLVLGLTLNPNDNNTLWVSHSLHRVIGFPSDNLNTTLTKPVFGQTDSSKTDTPTAVTSTSISLPRKTRFGCNNDFWITDSDYSRILRYPANSTDTPVTPNLFWGEYNFTTNDAQTTQNGFRFPTDIVFTDDCQVAFVADKNRVLRFRAPFSPYQNAEGVIGASNFTDSHSGRNYTEFNTIYRLQFKDNLDGTGRLYILDHGNGRIVSGTTQYTPATPTTATATPTTATATNPVTPSFSPSVGKPILQCDAQTVETCSLYHDVYISSTLYFGSDYSSVVINGSLFFSNSSRTYLSAGQTIKVAQTAQFGGVLTVVLSEDQLNEGSVINVTIASYGDKQGEFDNITIQVGSMQSEGFEGCQATSQSVYGEKSLHLIVSVSNCGKEQDGGINNKLVIGLVVGVGGCAIIVVVAGVVIGVVVVLDYHRSRKVKV